MQAAQFDSIISLEQILEKLNKTERIVRSSRMERFLSRPFRYAVGIGFREWLYPWRRRTAYIKSTTFFSSKVVCPLPGAMDIFLFGMKTHDSEVRLARFLISNIHSCSVFMDVGAHIGYYSLLVECAARVRGMDAVIHGIEPSSESFQLLKLNTEGISGIHVHHVAISDMDGAVPYFEFPDLYSEYNALDVTQYAGEEWFKKTRVTRSSVDSSTLDSFVIQNSVRPTLVKLDVEGAELKVLSGATAVLDEHRPILVMEFLADPHRNASHVAAHQLLLERNYQCFRITGEGALKEIADPIEYLKTSQLISDNLVYRALV